MTPTDIPTSVASARVRASWVSSCHCIQAWKSTRSASRSRSAATAGVAGLRSSSGQAIHAGPVLLDQGAPRREVGQPDALARPVRLVLAAPGRAAPRLADQFEGLALRLPHRVAVQQVVRTAQVAQRVAQLRDPGPSGGRHRREFGDRLDAEVQRVHEATGHRQVRRRLDRRHGRARVQRVDEDETGAQLAARPGDQLREVGQVADAPRPRGPHGVQLDEVPPGGAVRQRGRQLDSRRGHDAAGRAPCRPGCGRARGASPAAGRRQPKVASPISRPSTSVGSIHRSTWCRSCRTVPSSSSSHTSIVLPVRHVHPERLPPTRRAAPRTRATCAASGRRRCG